MGMFDNIGSALTGGILGLAGDVFSAGMAKRSADKQMDFQEEMSNTAYQRAMKDMEAVGLNPMLAAHLGGASTPQGAMYNPPPLGRAFTSGAQAFASAGQAEAESKRTEAETQPAKAYELKLEAEIEELRARAQHSRQAAYQANAAAEKIFQEARSALVEAGLMEKYGEQFRKGEWEVLFAEVKRARNEGEISETEAGKVFAWIHRFVQAIGGALGGFVGGAVGGLLGRGRSGGAGLRPGSGPGLRPPRMEWRAGGVVDRATGQLFRP